MMFFGYANGDNLLKHYAALLIKDKEHDELVGRINADNFYHSPSL